MKYLILTSLIFLTASFGCKSNPASPAGSGQIMPLALGNQWIYHDKNYDQKGQLVQEHDDTVKIKNVSVIDSETLYFDSYGYFYSHAYFNKNDGLWEYIISELNPNIEQISIPYPMKIDSAITDSIFKLISIDSIGNSRLDTILVSLTLKSSNALVSVPAGSFYCFVYQQDRTDTFTHEVIERYIFYYAINVGEVYEEDYDTYRNTPLHLSNKRSLISYKLF